MPKSASTLSPWLVGTRVHHRRVVTVMAAPKTSPTRPVVYRGREPEHVLTRELQDHLLIEKGYLPKYSGLPLEHFMESRRVSKEERRRLQRKERYWSKKR